MNTSDKLTKSLVVWMTEDEIAALDAIKRAGKYHSRSALARSILVSVLRDDAEAHGVSLAVSPDLLGLE